MIGKYYLGGRCWNGAHRDAGRVVHLVPDDESVFGQALCGARPGARSYGWAETDNEATCKRCLSKHEKLNQED